MKLIPIQCSIDDMQSLHLIVTQHIESHFPEGSADSSLIAREALQAVLSEIDTAIHANQPHFMFNKRLRAFLKQAIENATETKQIPVADSQRLLGLFKTQAHK